MSTQHSHVDTPSRSHTHTPMHECPALPHLQRRARGTTNARWLGLSMHAATPTPPIGPACAAPSTQATIQTVQNVWAPLLPFSISLAALCARFCSQTARSCLLWLRTVLGFPQRLPSLPTMRNATNTGNVCPFHRVSRAFHPFRYTEACTWDDQCTVAGVKHACSYANATNRTCVCGAEYTGDYPNCTKRMGSSPPPLGFASCTLLCSAVLPKGSPLPLPCATIKEHQRFPHSPSPFLLHRGVHVGRPVRRLLWSAAVLRPHHLD